MSSRHVSLEDWKERYYTIKCIICGKAVKSGTPIRKYCYDCKVKHRKEVNALRAEANRRPRKVDEPMNLMCLGNGGRFRGK